MEEKILKIKALESNMRALSQQIMDLQDLLRPNKYRCWDYYNIELMLKIEKSYKSFHKAIYVIIHELFSRFPKWIAKAETYMQSLTQHFQRIESIIQPREWSWGVTDMYTNEDMYTIIKQFEAMKEIMRDAICYTLYIYDCEVHGFSMLTFH